MMGAVQEEEDLTLVFVAGGIVLVIFILVGLYYYTYKK